MDIVSVLAALVLFTWLAGSATYAIVSALVTYVKDNSFLDLLINTVLILLLLVVSSFLIEFSEWLTSLQLYKGK